MSGYFGPAHLRKEGERQVDTPIGKLCVYCHEAIAEGDAGTLDRAGKVIHHECLMRSIVGSVGHQRKRCSCYGGTEEDPQGMTRREAARAATELWEKLNAPATAEGWRS